MATAAKKKVARRRAAGPKQELFTDAKITRTQVNILKDISNGNHEWFVGPNVKDLLAKELIFQSADQGMSGSFGLTTAGVDVVTICKQCRLL